MREPSIRLLLLDRWGDECLANLEYDLDDFHNNPRSANDTTRCPATTKWSSVRMSTRASACFNACVNSSSAREGSATPDGWLCAKITAAALRESAALTTSRGYTLVCARVPRNSSSSPSKRCCSL